MFPGRFYCDSGPYCERPPTLTHVPPAAVHSQGRYEILNIPAPPPDNMNHIGRRYERHTGEVRTAGQVYTNRPPFYYNQPPYTPSVYMGIVTSVGGEHGLGQRQGTGVGDIVQGSAGNAIFCHSMPGSISADWRDREGKLREERREHVETPQRAGIEPVARRTEQGHELNTASAKLVTAVQIGNTEEARRSVAEGANLETRTMQHEQDLTPLHIACCCGHYETAQYLVEAGASTQIATCKGYSAVHWASYGGDINILKLLQKNECDFEASTENGSRPLHIAVLCGRSNAAAWLVCQGVALEKPNKRHQIPLDLADTNPEVKIFLKMAIRQNKLLEAAAEGDMALLQELIALRVDVNARSHTKNYRGYQALHRAAEEGQTQAVRMLLEHKAAPDARTKLEGPMAVHLAAQGGHSKIVKLILPHMSCKTKEATVEGKSLIHLAAMGGHLDVLECLYQEGFDLNIATVDTQQTPLHLACECENESAARWLLAAGADVCRPDHRGYLAKDAASEAGNTKLASYLDKTETALNRILTPKWNFASPVEAVGPRRRGKAGGRNLDSGRQEAARNNLPKGLESIGNTCYMNAVLQCLYHTTQLTLFLQSDDWRSSKSGKASEYGGEVVERYSQVVRALFTPKGRTLPALLHLKETVSQFDSLFLGNNQQEAHDMLTFLLDALDKELQHEGPSYVAQLFEGVHVSVITCPHSAKTIWRVTEPFTNLSLPVTKRSMRNGQRSLQQCLQKYYEPQNLEWDCHLCNKSHMCQRKIFIKKLPQILVIHLSRVLDSPNDRYKENVTIPLTLMEMGDYTKERHSSSSSRAYELYGICQHEGTSLSGHYTAWCRAMEGEAWRHFSDHQVTQTDGKAPNTHAAHLLFYETRQ